MTFYCKNHPQKETALRCNRCEEPMCPSCAVHTPTGYRCKDCVKEQGKIFNTAEWYDYISGFAAAAVLSAIASFIISAISFMAGFFMFIFVFGIASAAATIIARVVKRALRGRRSKNLFITSTAGVVIGALPIIIFFLIVGNFYSIIWQGIYLFVAVPAVFYSIAGFKL